MIGETLNQRYDVDTQIGRGAMGEVFRAVDHQSRDMVAIKFVPPDLLSDPVYRERFKREVITLQKLHHPNIVRYIDAFSYQGGACLVMEYVAGGTLQDFLKARGAMPDGLLKQIALQIIDAVAFAHHMDVIHRDLKPANILLTTTGKPRIADFGLAKLLDLSTLTQSGALMGTLAYMPPEAFDTLQKQDHRGDIWALGVILFEMMSGNLPFRGRSQAQVVAAILSDEPRSLQTIRRDIPPAWSAIVRYCLQKNPGERYRSAREVFDDLRADTCRYLTGEPSTESNNLDSWLADLDNQFPDASQSATVVPGIASEKTVRPEDTPAVNSSEYHFQFIQPKAAVSGEVMPSELPVRRDPGKRAKIRDIRDIPMPEQPSGKSGTFGLAVFGGVFTWLGMMAMIVGAFLTLISSVQVEEDRLADSNVLLPMAALGVSLFVVGMLFEIPDAESVERMLMLATITGGVISGFFLVLGAIYVDFFAAILATLTSLAVVITYFSVKGFA